MYIIINERATTWSDNSSGIGKELVKLKIFNEIDDLLFLSIIL